MPPKSITSNGSNIVPPRQSTRVSKGSHRLTCSSCRARKVKCDGSTPECKICQAYGKACHYDKAPPVSQVLAMTQHIQEMERTLNMLENDRYSRNPSTPTQAVAQLPTVEASSNIDQSDQLEIQSSAVPRDIRQLDQNDRTSDQDSLPTFKSTSAVHGPFLDNEKERSPEMESSVQTFRAAPMSAEQLGLWQSRAIQQCAAHLHLPPDKIGHLFNTYWTWVYPAFMFVTRPQFLMDSAVGDRYSSPLLCSVICLQATRFTDHMLREELLSHVRFLLGQEIHHAPSVPLVQSLLQLSAREVGNGATSQAWLYSGMAFRLAVDMGLMVKPTNPVSNPTESSVRGQLAWSCYLWDKAMSLYLGRTPSLPECPDFEPTTMDEAIETELWIPYLGNSEMNTTWMPSKSHGITCFINFCKIGKIINEVLATIYAKKPDANVLGLVQQIRGRLETWRTESPPHLVMMPGSRSCPPPHILSQNMLFHTTKILLYRPFRNHAQCRSICKQASAEVEHLLLLLENTLGLTHTTYLMAYCAYTAATVAMLDLHDGVEGSQTRVNTFLRALYGVLKSCPAIQRSIDIIVKAFDCRSATKTSSQVAASTVDEQLPEPDPLPAFPLDEFNEYDSWNFNQNALPFGSLDPYAMDWALFADNVFD